MCSRPAIAALMLLTATALAGPEPEDKRPWPSPDPRFYAPHETAPYFDEPPQPGVRRTSPPLPPELLRRGRFQSVQVNVDEFGNNIIGDAANEPSLAMDHIGAARLVIGWRQFDTVESDFRRAGWAYSHDYGQTWTFPGVLEDTVFRSDPVVSGSPDGTFYYYSLDHALYCEMFRSTDAGVSWSGPIPAYGGDKAWMAVDQTRGVGNGNIYSAWDEAGCCGDNRFTRSVDGGLSWMYPVEMPGGPEWGTISVGPDGAVYVVGMSYYYYPFALLRSDNAQDPAQTPEFDLVTPLDLGGDLASYTTHSPNPGGLTGQVWVACDCSDGPYRGNVYVLASVWPWDSWSPQTDVMFMRSTDRGQTWSTPVRINDDEDPRAAWHWFGTMSVAPNGRIDAVWNDTRNSGSFQVSEVYYSYSTDGGQTWSANEPITPQWDSWLGWPLQNKIGDYYQMISDNLSAGVAYAATFNGEQDVYFVRIGPPDCNNNGVPDDQDIASGTSRDMNGNGIPDDCDQDCNHNGVLDWLDIDPTDPDGDGWVSPDCDGNGVPDECEVGGTEDCNGNGLPDLCDIYFGTSPDCNNNGVPDECDIANGFSHDCNGNGVPDECDIASGFSRDCDGNGRPDECDLAGGVGDCNLNGIYDACELLDGLAQDCNGNGMLDECDIAAGTSADCQPNGIPDECEPTAAHDFCEDAQIVCPGRTYYGTTIGATNDGSAGCGDSDAAPDVWYFYQPAGGGYLQLSLCGSKYDTVLSVHADCPGTSANQLVCSDDYCGAQSSVQIYVTGGQSYWLRISGAAGAAGCFGLTVTGPACAYSSDCNSNGVPDDCEPDCNGNGQPDDCDITAGVSLDLDGDGIPDECEQMLGDLNCDGQINVFDIDPFVLAISGAEVYAAAFPDCDRARADCNQDGAVNVFDIDAFVRLIAAGGGGH